MLEFPTWRKVWLWGITLVAVAASLPTIFNAANIRWPAQLPDPMVNLGLDLAGGIALISSLGNLGPSVMPVITSWVKTTTGTQVASLYFVMALYLAAATILAAAPSARCGETDAGAATPGLPPIAAEDAPRAGDGGVRAGGC